MIKLIAFDLDGTLTQHKTPLEPANYEALVALSKKYKLLMAGAGACMRIFNQLEGFPIDVIGNYGLQYGEYNPETKTLDIKENNVLPCDKESVAARVTMCREKYGFTEYAGDNVQYHDSGCVTFPILGTDAKQEDKLAFDPDRVKRRKIYAEVCETFSDYNVFVGGSSSFDMAPRPFNKFYAISKYCKERGIDLSEVAFVGDDYGPGGNDESVYLSPIRFITIDDYRTFPEVMREAGLLD
jgi:HAD superfamily hydrolase (TIGR01484 family)